MKQKRKKIAILGSTGSIGTQALDVVLQFPDLFQITLLTAYKNSALLIQQAKKFKPSAVVIVDESKYQEVKRSLSSLNISVFTGEESLSESVKRDDIDLVLTALVGYSGLKPTISAIKSNKIIALANKETLVVAGKLITDLCKQYNTSIYPVDSEHSAIFQCLVGEKGNSVEKIYLTASGGPFFKKTKSELLHVSKQQALKHPNWEMGKKITIDSATLMNKGLEVIEAKWLFDLKLEQIEVVVHPESIIHSAVQFQDGSIKAQLGLPDMKLPIQYALGFPKRLKNNFARFSFFDYPNLTFEKPNLNVFKNLGLAYQAMEKGGNMPCVLNAANEIAVDAFLKDKIGFLNMSDLIADCMEKITFVANPSFEDYVETNKEARLLALKLL